MEIVYNKYKISEELIKQVLKQSRDRYTHGNKRVVLIGDIHAYNFEVEKYFSTEVVNRGVIEDTTLTLLQTIDFRAVELNPSKLFIIIGTNDIGFRFNSSVTVNNIEFLLQYLANAIPATKIYLCLIPPTNHDYTSGNINILATSARSIYKIEKVNRLMCEVAEKNNVEIIDLFAPLIGENGDLDSRFSIDGLSLSEAGYKVLASVLKKYIP